MKALECSQHFSNYKSDLFRRSRVANSADPSQILLNFEPIKAFIAVRVSCKNKEDPMKNGKARVLTRFSPIISLWELSVAMETSSDMMNLAMFIVMT